MTDLPQKIGPYHIHRLLGAGGMSTVYVATDPRNATTVALKVLPTHFANNADYLKRFLREGQNARRLHHPNLVSVFDAGEADGRYYIAMELIQGSTLSQAMRARNELLPLPQIVHILRQVAAGLDHAHREGFLHRDIKPSNILIEGAITAPTVRAVLSDFGVAQQLDVDQTLVTQQGHSIGTPAFMSPEQARGDAQIDRRSDIYSLGVAAYLLCTGKLPFKADNQYSLMRQIVDEPPAPASEWNSQLPPGVVYVLNRVLAKDAGARYDSAGLFVAALAEAAVWTPSAQQEYPPTPSRPITSVQPQVALPATFSTRRRWAWLMTALFVLIGLLLAVTLSNRGNAMLAFLRGSQPVPAIVLTPYSDPNGRFHLNVPSSWRQIPGQDGIDFEATEFPARIFIHQLQEAPAGSNAAALLDYYVAQQMPPFGQMELLSQENRTHNGSQSTERHFRGVWLGSNVQIKLMAIQGNPQNQTDLFVLGSVVEADRAAVLADLLQSVADSFALTIVDSALASEQNSSVAITVPATRPPTSTPVRTRPATATPPIARVGLASTATITPTAGDLANSQSITATALLTNTPAPSPTLTATAAPTDTAAPTFTPTPTSSATTQPTATETAAPPSTASATVTPVPTHTSAPTPSSTTETATATPTPTATATALPAATDTAAPTSTSTVTDTPPSTNTPLPTHTAAATHTATASATTMPATAAPTSTPIPTDTAVPSSTPTATALPTAEPTATPTFTPSATFTSSATFTPLPTATPLPTLTPTYTATATHTATATRQPTSTPFPTRTPTDTPTATATRTAPPTPTLIPTRTATATATFTRAATNTPTPNGTATAVFIENQRATATAQALLVQASIRATLTAVAQARPPAATATTAAPAGTSAPVPPGAAVTLQAPLDATLRGRQSFRWSSNITLGANQSYEMVFWPAGGDPMASGFGPAGARTESEVIVDLDKAAGALPHLLISGQEYEWGVLLVELTPYRRLQYLGGGHRFRFEAAGGGGGGGSAPTPTPRG